MKISKITCCTHLTALLLLPTQAFLTNSFQRVKSYGLTAGNGMWGVGESWDSLSNEGDGVSAPLSPEEMNDPIGRAVKILEQEAHKNDAQAYKMDFIDQAVETIQSFHGDPSDPPLYDTTESLEKYVGSDQFAADADQEISLLLRCNKSPETFLVKEGRALFPLTKDERHDIAQLVLVSLEQDPNTIEITDFVKDAVSKMFLQHAKTEEKSNAIIMDRGCVAKWMTQSLGEGSISKHDKRVTSGFLTDLEFLNLYKDAIMTSLDANGKPLRLMLGQQSGLDAVWRDLTAHDILTPNEQAWESKMDEIRKTYSVDRSVSSTSDMFVDECEILEWKEDAAIPKWEIDSQGSSNQRKMSHEIVELCMDGKTPKAMSDGQFVFIDEASCIGCNQCVQISPSSFIMLDTGRARTFNQRHAKDVETAVSACPVSCMKHVSFNELKEMETVRDKGDGRSDHRHKGQNIAYTPLKNKCFMSHDCPRKGCYDCPFYSQPGANPYFKELQVQARKARLEHIYATGEADKYRKTADL